jgi:ATP synthase subunit 6
MLIISPLEQFSIIPLFLFSNIFYYILIIFFSFLILSVNSYLLNKLIGFWIVSMKGYQNQIFILMIIFILIFFSNVLGMIPYSFTITAQIAIVFSMSIPTFISLNILGIRLHRHNIFYLFLPVGGPIVLIPFLVILEIFSYFIRVFSLTLRLSANLISGHILMKILIYILLDYIIIAPLVIPIIILELFVACIQSYIFLLLILSYHNDILYPH